MSMRIQTTFAMQGFRFVVIVGFCVMLAALFYGFIKGDFFTEGKRLMDMPWGVVTFIDVYVGIFTAWVWYGEASAFAVSLAEGEGQYPSLYLWL